MLAFLSRYLSIFLFLMPVSLSFDQTIYLSICLCIYLSSGLSAAQTAGVQWLYPHAHPKVLHVRLASA